MLRVLFKVAVIVLLALCAPQGALGQEGPWSLQGSFGLTAASFSERVAGTKGSFGVRLGFSPRLFRVMAARDIEESRCGHPKRIRPRGQILRILLLVAEKIDRTRQGDIVRLPLHKCPDRRLDGDRLAGLEDRIPGLAFLSRDRDLGTQR